MLDDILYNTVTTVGKLFRMAYFESVPQTYGLSNIETGPKVYYSNHLQFFIGTWSVGSSLPERVYPWVDSRFVVREEAIRLAKREKGFFRQKLGDNFLGNTSAEAFARFFSWGLNLTEAVPVYRDANLRGTKEIPKTYSESVSRLRENKPLLVFPERVTNDKPDELGMWKFQYGFLKIAEEYFDSQHDIDELDYYPVAVAPTRGDVMIYSPFTLNRQEIPSSEKERREWRSRNLPFLENQVRNMVTVMEKLRDRAKLHAISTSQISIDDYL